MQVYKPLTYKAKTNVLHFNFRGVVIREQFIYRKFIIFNSVAIQIAIKNTISNILPITCWNPVMIQTCDRRKFTIETMELRPKKHLINIDDGCLISNLNIYSLQFLSQIIWIFPLWLCHSYKREHNRYYKTSNVNTCVAF